MTQNCKLPNPAPLLLLLAAVLIYGACSCNCNKPKPPVAVLPGAEMQPLVDSLTARTQLLEDSVAILKTDLYNASVDQEIAKRQGLATADKLQKALAEKDTVRIIEYAENCEDDFRAFVVKAVKKDSVQTAVITKQEAQIKGMQLTIDAKDFQIQSLQKGVKDLHAENAAIKKDLAKSERKRKGAKLLNKIAVPVAVAAVSYIILSL